MEKKQLEQQKHAAAYDIRKWLEGKIGLRDCDYTFYMYDKEHNYQDYIVLEIHRTLLSEEQQEKVDAEITTHSIKGMTSVKLSRVFEPAPGAHSFQIEPAN